MKSYCDIKEQHEMLGWEPNSNEHRNAAYNRARKEILQQYLRYVEPLNKLKARYLETEFTGITLYPDGRVETTMSDDYKEAIKEIDRLQAYFLKTLVTDKLEKLGLKEGGNSE